MDGVMATKVADEQLLSQYALATMYFRDFLPFVNITESGSGIIPLEMWPHIEEMVDDLESERLIAWAKPRQISATTILSAYALWHAMFIPKGWVLDISKGQDDSHLFLAKSREVWTNLPKALKAPLGESSNQGLMTFANGGKIEALPSTTDAGRGKNPTLAIFDEADYHEYLAEAINAVKPGLDDRDGKLVMSSTWNPHKTGSLFQRTYQNPSNGYKKRFWPYSVRPGRDEVWYEEKKLEYDDQALFEKEFPRSEEEMMAPANAIAFFDLPTIRAMGADCKDPIEIVTVGNGVQANIYQKMMEGKRYAAATDTSHATGKDYAVTTVMDVQTGYIVADIYSNVVDATELAIGSVELLRDHYDSPIWGIEDNDWGVLTLRIAQELKYKRLYYRDDDGEKPGWHTFDTAAHATDGSRFVMLGDLYRAVKSRLISIPNREGLQQFMTMIRNPKKKGRIEAQEGGHDDYPMAVAIAWQLRGQARPAGSVGKTLNPNTDSSFQPLRRGGGGRNGWGSAMGVIRR
jgi:hypothetical protein